jgi:hypothetical protein
MNTQELKRWAVEQAVILRSQSPDNPRDLTDEVQQIVKAFKKAGKLLGEWS